MNNNQPDKDIRDEYLRSAIDRLDTYADKTGRVALSLRKLSHACAGEMDTDDSRVASLLSVNLLPSMMKTLDILMDRLLMLEEWVCGKPAPGDIPHSDGATPTYEQLTRALREAIDAEEYERAEKIRAEIDRKHSNDSEEH